MKQYKVGIIGSTGMVGQRFISLLENHPYFKITHILSSDRNAGKTYEVAMKKRWILDTPIPDNIKNLILLDGYKDAQFVSENVDFVFCAVDMQANEIIELEQLYAKLECPVISNNSANRLTDDVPMIIPEINPQHIDIIPIQRKRLGTKRGFIAVKSNCSIQSYVPALTPLLKLGILSINVCTYQAISGAAKNFETFPEILGNIIPYIGGEEEKSEIEPLKIWGEIKDNVIKLLNEPNISAQCIRVPVLDGHLACVNVKFSRKVCKDEILKLWNDMPSLNLPSSPEKFITYFTENNRPQPKLDRDLYKGMGISVGRLRTNNNYDYKFISLSHNTIRGASGGAILLAELLCDKGYIKENLL